MMMKKLNKVDKLYMEEMIVFLKQKDERVIDCQQNIETCRKLIVLERQQLRIKARMRKESLQVYNEWRKEKGLKVVK